MNCPSDADRLVAFEELFQWEGRRTAAHLATCDECGEMLDDLERLRSALLDTVEPRSGTTDAVMAKLRGTRAPTPRRSRRRSLVPAFTFLLATVTAMAALLALAAALDGAPGTLAGAIVVSMLFGAAVVRRTQKAGGKALDVPGKRPPTG